MGDARAESVSLLGRCRALLESTVVLHWVPVICWMAAIIVLPRFLRPSLSASQGSLHKSLMQELVRGGIHIVEYAVLTVLLYRAIKAGGERSSLPGMSRRTRIPWTVFGFAFLIAIGFGLFDEAQQSLIPNRQPSVIDLMADALGVLIAMAGLVGISRL